MRFFSTRADIFMIKGYSAYYGTGSEKDYSMVVPAIIDLPISLVVDVVCYPFDEYRAWQMRTAKRLLNQALQDGEIKPEDADKVLVYCRWDAIHLIWDKGEVGNPRITEELLNAALRTDERGFIYTVYHSKSQKTREHFLMLVQWAAALENNENYWRWERKYPKPNELLENLLKNPSVTDELLASSLEGMDEKSLNAISPLVERLR